LFKRPIGEIFLSELVLPVVCAGPPHLAYRALEILGHARSSLAWRTRCATERRVDAALGPLDPGILREVTRRLFVTQLVMQAAELPLVRASDASLARLVDVEGLQHLEEARAAGRGTILLSSHVGFSLLGCYVLRRRGYPVVRTGVSPGDGRVLQRMQRQATAQLARVWGRSTDDILYEAAASAPLSLKRMHSALAGNQILFLAGDGLMGSRGATASLLGKPVDFPTGWVSLARLTGASVIPTFVTRDPRSTTFQIRLSPRLSRALVDGDDAAAVEAYARQLDAHVRRHPCHAVTLFLRRPSIGTLAPSWDAAFPMAVAPD